METLETMTIIAAWRSEKVGELIAALAKAQLEFTAIVKDQTNPYYSSKYADLSSVIAATQPALAKNGLVILQQAVVNAKEQSVTIRSTLAHVSDQWIENELILPAVMAAKDGKLRFDAQSCGAFAMTYGRRYAYQGLVGVAAEQDSDGNGLTTKNATPQNGKPTLETPQKRSIGENQSRTTQPVLWKSKSIRRRCQRH